MKPTSLQIADWKSNARRIVNNALSVGEYSTEVNSNAEGREILALVDNVFTKAKVQNIGCGVKRITVTRNY